MQQRTTERAEAKHMPKKPPPASDAVLKEAIREHFRETAQRDVIFSMPAAALAEVETLGIFLDSSEAGEAKRRRLLSGGCGDRADGITLDVEPGAEPEGQAVAAMFFKPVMLMPSTKKVLACGPWGRTAGSERTHRGSHLQGSLRQDGWGRSPCRVSRSVRSPNWTRWRCWGTLGTPLSWRSVFGIRRMFSSSPSWRTRKATAPPRSTSWLPTWSSTLHSRARC